MLARAKNRMKMKMAAARHAASGAASGRGGGANRVSRDTQVHAFLAELSPQQVFRQFDTDQSGAINFDEFRQMLHALGVHIPTAKAIRLFKAVDRNNSGDIDRGEFEMALYAVNPRSGSRSFRPHDLLTPGDAFDMFDTDGSGALDEDEFALLMEYLGLDLEERRVESLFKKVDKDGNGAITFPEFKRVWLQVVDIREQLEARGVVVGRWVSPWTLMKKLERIIDKEERAHFLALEEARRWHVFRKKQRIKREDARRARRLADVELTNALDSGGCVYVFGNGKNDCMCGEPVPPRGVDVEKLSRLWSQRMRAPTLEDAALEGDPEAVAELFVQQMQTANAQRLSMKLADKAAKKRAAKRDKSLFSKEDVDYASESTETTDSELGRLSVEESSSDEYDASEASTASDSTEQAMPRQILKKPKGGVGSRPASALNRSRAAMEELRWRPDMEPGGAPGARGGIRQRPVSRPQSAMPRLGGAAANHVPVVKAERGDPGEAAARKGPPSEAGDSVQTGLTIMGAAPAAESSAPGGQESIRRPFIGYNVQHNTVSLWCKRTVQAEVGATSVLALNDGGDVFAWGGTSKWWETNRHRPDAVKPAAVAKTERQRRRDNEILKAQRAGDFHNKLALPEGIPAPGTEATARTQDSSSSPRSSEADAATESKDQPKDRVTPRSAMLLTTSAAGPWQGESAAQRRARQNNHARMMLEAEANRIKSVAIYFKVWQPPKKDADRLAHMKNVLLPVIPMGPLKYSLELRGDYAAAGKAREKEELVHLMADCLEVEARHLSKGERKQVRALDWEIRTHVRDGNKMAAKVAQFSFERIWARLVPKLAEHRAEVAQRNAALKHQRSLELERDYRLYRTVRARAAAARAKGTWGAEQESTVRGNHPLVHVGGVTQRGAQSRTPRGTERVFAVAAGQHHFAVIHRLGGLMTWGNGSHGRLGHGSVADKAVPTAVDHLDEHAMAHVSCGRMHTACITADGELYIWGSVHGGKTGIRIPKGARARDLSGLPFVVSLDKLGDLSLQLPTPLPIRGVRRVVSVSCGFAHTACVSDGGQLFVWGSGNSGRLGLGRARQSDVYTPTFVESLSGHDIVQVSCGVTHTVARTRVSVEATETGMQAVGGRVFVAGAANALGMYVPAFKTLPELARVNATHVSAGFDHTAVVTWHGEVWSWGNNAGGGACHPLELDYVKVPTRVACLYTRPQNLALGRPARQSSVYNNRLPGTAVNGSRDGLGEGNVCHTQFQPNAWVDIDLGAMASIEQIRLFNRQDEWQGRTERADKFSCRLFPCFIMLSATPFPEGSGPGNFSIAVAQSSVKKRLDTNQRESVWDLPACSVGRYVRVQLERANYLHIAELEVYGEYGVTPRMRKVSHVSCGHGATVVIVPPNSREDAVTYYRRAIAADPYNALILREFETFFDVYDEWGFDYRKKKRGALRRAAAGGDDRPQLGTITEEGTMVEGASTTRSSQQGSTARSQQSPAKSTSHGGNGPQRDAGAVKREVEVRAGVSSVLTSALSRPSSASSEAAKERRRRKEEARARRRAVRRRVKLSQAQEKEYKKERGDVFADLMMQGMTIEDAAIETAKIMEERMDERRRMKFGKGKKEKKGRKKRDGRDARRRARGRLGTVEEGGNESNDGSDSSSGRSSRADEAATDGASGAEERKSIDPPSPAGLAAAPAVAGRGRALPPLRLPPASSASGAAAAAARTATGAVAAPQSTAVRKQGVITTIGAAAGERAQLAINKSGVSGDDTNTPGVLRRRPRPGPETGVKVDYDIDSVLSDAMDAYIDPGQNECPLCAPGRRCPVCSFHKKFVARLLRQRHEALVEFEAPELVERVDDADSDDSAKMRQEIIEQDDPNPFGPDNLGDDERRRRRARRRRHKYLRLARKREQERALTAPTLGVGGSHFQPGDPRKRVAEGDLEVARGLRRSSIGASTMMQPDERAETGRTSVNEAGAAGDDGGGSVAGRSATSHLSYRSRLRRVDSAVRRRGGQDIMGLKLHNVALMKQRGLGFGELEPNTDTELLIASARSDLTHVPSLEDIVEEVGKLRTWNLDNIISLVIETERPPMVAEEPPPEHIKTIEMTVENMLISAANKKRRVMSAAKAAAWKSRRLAGSVASLRGMAWYRTKATLKRYATCASGPAQVADEEAVVDAGIAGGAAEGPTLQHFEMRMVGAARARAGAGLSVDGDSSMASVSQATPSEVGEGAEGQPLRRTSSQASTIRAELRKGSNLSKEAIETAFAPKSLRGVVEGGAEGSESLESEELEGPALPPPKQPLERSMRLSSASSLSAASQRRPQSALPRTKSRMSLASAHHRGASPQARASRPQSAVPSRRRSSNTDEKENARSPAGMNAATSALPPKKARPQSAAPTRSASTQRKARQRPQSALPARKPREHGEHRRSTASRGSAGERPPRSSTGGEAESKASADAGRPPRRSSGRIPVPRPRSAAMRASVARERSAARPRSAMPSLRASADASAGMEGS